MANQVERTYNGLGQLAVEYEAVSGPVTSTNSLVGTQSNDRVGIGGVWDLSKSNYVVSNPLALPFAGILGMALLGVVLYEALDALDAWATRWRRAAQ